MNGYLPQKAIIFFNPGKPGIVFTHTAKTFISVRQLLNLQEYFVKMTKQSVVYIEDRRLKERFPDTLSE